MDRYLIYLRKSRADREAETREGGDTLARHRRALLDLARRMDFSVAAIYEEVVSGETIAARPEMRKLLREVESGLYAGVLVMEVERLARGNTADQGVVAETFQYSGTRIVTPVKIYDPADEADQEYFEFGLFMSRREYKAINRRLQRGREASLKEGKYIAGTAPYGYLRVKLRGQKGYTLEIDQSRAPVVRRIFSLYAYGERLADGSSGGTAPAPSQSFWTARRSHPPPGAPGAPVR
jgi:DNA invertase Pin-like site-specific DNA recombinase